MITDKNEYLLQYLHLGANYAVQVAVLRHARTKNKCLEREKSQTIEVDIALLNCMFRDSVLNLWL